ncbi:MAG: hypothetical protein E7392_06605, partial [Ruminococcaceae bacterium]|nr:hypothetical protein [Oscillospiraceae bacterium]
MKKTFISVISGALAGGMIASVMTLGVVGYIDREDILPERKGSYVRIDESGFTPVTAVTAEKEVLTVEEIAKHVGPSIVGISCSSVVQSYFGSQTAQSSGSGIIIDASGHIVTNYHVIE